MRYIQLGNLVELKQGLAINAKSNHLVSKEKTNLALLRIADMPTKSKVVFMSEDTPERFIASEDDIIYTRTGQVGLVFRKQQGVVHNNCFRVIPNNKEELDKGYLYWYLSLNGVRNFANSIASGSAQPDLPHTTFKKIKIWLPVLEMQTRIANILDQYDLAIENNNKRIKLLEQMAENLYKEWFVRFRFPGYEDVELENGLPKGWEYTKLERLTNISTGKCNREDAEEDGAYPLFDRSQEIKRSNVWLKDCEAIIVPGEGTSFIPRYYNGKFNLHQRCYCVEPLEKGMGFFLYQTLMMYRIYFLYVATGATVPSLRLNNFNNFKVLLPKKELCFQYNEIAEKMNDEILLLKNKNELLAKQRDMLLPRLMSGKLEV